MAGGDKLRNSALKLVESVAGGAMAAEGEAAGGRRRGRASAYMTGTGVALAGMATARGPSSSPSTAALIARSRAEGNTKERPSPEKAAPPQAATKERQERRNERQKSPTAAGSRCDLWLGYVLSDWRAVGDLFTPLADEGDHTTQKWFESDCDTRSLRLLIAMIRLSDLIGRLVD